MFSISLSLSLLAERWEYKWGLHENDEGQVVPPHHHHQQQHRTTSTLPSPSNRTQRGSVATPRQQATPTTMSGPFHVDTSYTSLSEHARDMQRQTRLRLIERERAADVESLRRLEVATAGALGRQKDRERFRELEGATSGTSGRAGKQAYHKSLRTPSLERRQRQGKPPAASPWSGISPPSSTVLSKIHGLNGTPVSWDLSGSTVSTPRSNDVVEALNARVVQALALAGPTLDRRLRAHDAETADAKPAEEKRHDYAKGPFGAGLVARGRGQEVRLRKSFEEYRRQQAESVLRLFDRVRVKDEKSRSEIAEDVGSLSKSDAGEPSRSPSVVSSAGSREQEASPCERTVAFRKGSLSGSGNGDEKIRKSSSVVGKDLGSGSENAAVEHSRSPTVAPSEDSKGQEASPCVRAVTSKRRGSQTSGAGSSDGELARTPEWPASSEDGGRSSRAPSSGASDKGSPPIPSADSAGASPTQREGESADEEKMVIEGLPKAEPDEVEDDWLLI